MNIVQITPGAGGMYCGNCFRDNALVAELRQLGHQTLLVPLYLPMRLEEADQTAGTPIFFGGVSVYLEQKFPIFSKAPDWLRDVLSARPLLQWASGKAAKTRPEDVGDIAISMLRGEEGNQARELTELVAWMKTQPKPGVVCLSNALLAGMARQIREDLDTPVVCTLQGEDYFLDSMAAPHREVAWRTLTERCADIDLFIAPSRYFGDLMAGRLGLPAEKVAVIPNGINLAGYPPGLAAPEATPVLGYLARMCPEKGLDTLVEAFLQLKQRAEMRRLRLKIAGGCGPGDEAFVEKLRERLRSAGHLADVEFHPNLDREAKVAFLRSLTVFSVPALYGEAFGLYLLEALAAGVPVVQPRHASFPEIVEATGGGLIAEAGNPGKLAEAIASLLVDPARARAFGEAGQQAVRERFTIRRLAEDSLDAFARAERNYAASRRAR